MNTKLALSIVAAALLTACAGLPTWEAKEFSNHSVSAKAVAGERADQSPDQYLGVASCCGGD